MVVRLFTSNYQQFRPEMGVPVQASNGYPRWGLKYPLTQKARETYPPRPIMNLPDLQFEQKYAEHLDSIGVDRLRKVFEGIARSEGEDRLVLLCFERFDDPKKPHNPCHRTSFAAWWEAQTGEKVREIGPPPTGQGTLL